MSEKKLYDKDYSYLPECIKSKNFKKPIQSTLNGYILNDSQLPLELLSYILEMIDPKEILQYRLVCQNWNDLITSFSFWSHIYQRKYHRRAKKLPWYLYYCLLSTSLFDTNLLKNFDTDYAHWRRIDTIVDKWFAEPDASGPSLDFIDFSEQRRGFLSNLSYVMLTVQFRASNLFNYILTNYKPHIYINEWVANACHYGFHYEFQCESENDEEEVKAKWRRIEMCIQNYPEDVTKVLNEYQSCDLRVRECGYGDKIGKSVLKILFDSIEPLPLDKNGFKQPKRFKRVLHKINPIMDEIRPALTEPRNLSLINWNFFKLMLTRHALAVFVVAVGVIYMYYKV